MKVLKFNSVMLRRVSQGYKTQTRRPIKPQPEPLEGSEWVLHAGLMYPVIDREPSGFYISPPYLPGESVLAVKTDLSDSVDIKITDIRIEHLQDITEEDAKAEGVEPTFYPICCGRGGYECCGEPEPAEEFIPPFRDLWDDIYFDKGYGWAKNPWVHVISFEKVT